MQYLLSQRVLETERLAKVSRETIYKCIMKVLCISMQLDRAGRARVELLTCITRVLAEL